MINIRTYLGYIVAVLVKSIKKIRPMFSSCNGTFQMKESSKEPSNNNLMLEYNDDIPVPVLDPRPHSLYPSSWSLTCGPASVLCPCRITFASTQQLLPVK